MLCIMYGACLYDTPLSKKEILSLTVLALLSFLFVRDITVRLFILWALFQGVSDFKTRYINSLPDIVLALFLALYARPVFLVVALMILCLCEFINDRIPEGDAAMIALIILCFESASSFVLLFALLLSLFFVDKNKAHDTYKTTPLVFGATLNIPLAVFINIAH